MKKALKTIGQILAFTTALLFGLWIGLWLMWWFFHLLPLPKSLP